MLTENRIDQILPYLMKISTPLNALILCFALIIGSLGDVLAQADPLIFNNGAFIYIRGNGITGDSAVVWVDGGVTNNDSLLVNKGKLIVMGDFINNGECGRNTTSPVNLYNGGLFEVHGDWENNGVFNAGESLVKFMTTDTIQGDSVTRFHNVDLVGDIRRIQENVNAEIGENGILKLNVGEWATDFDTLWIFNTATGAVQRNADFDTSGFVSSLSNGNLARAVAQDASYRFPVGSSIDISPNQKKRYRPVSIKPQTNDADWFHVRFVNRDASIDVLPISNIDSTICYVNPWWYHRINQTGGAVPSADISLYADPNDPDFPDEDYNTIANWSTASVLWENMGNTASSLLGGLDQVVRYDWDDFQSFEDDAYIMAFNVPDEPPVDGDNAMCASIEETYTVPDNGSDYEFIVTGGTVISETDYSVTVVWDNDSLNPVFGNVQVIETVPNNINGGCASLTRNYTVEVWPLPVANFSVVTDPTLPGGIFIHDILEMADSSLLTSEWHWDFGDGVTSTDSLPFHSYYETGTYDIELIVRSGLECVDTMVISVDVVEGLIVPNVFTPNNDGWNDVFDVRTSAVGNFNLEIFNRWGNRVYENASPLISWDGTTQAGVEAPAGTYFYVITKAEMESGNAINNELDNFNFKETGWLQLLR